MLENYNISKGMVDNLPNDLLHRYQVLPVDLFGDTMSVAMSQHLTLEAFHDLQEKSNHDITFFVALISKVRNALSELVPIDDSKLQEIRKQKAVQTTKASSWTDIFDTANKSVMGTDALQKKDKGKKGLDLFDTANIKVMKNLQPKVIPKKPAAQGGGLDIFDMAQKKVADGIKKKIVPKPVRKVVPKPGKKKGK